VVDCVNENELVGLNTSDEDEDDDMENRLGDTEEPKPAGAVCFNARPACWYSPNPFLQLRAVLSCSPEGPSGESTPPFFEVAKNPPIHSTHIFWDSAEPNGTGTEVLKCAQFGEHDQGRDKPLEYAHGSWHEGARVEFFVGTTRQLEIDKSSAPPLRSFPFACLARL
jgi:hypothetical protein